MATPSFKLLAKRTTGADDSMYDLIWFWKSQPWPGRAVDRKGRSCRVLARGAMNNVLVEFQDGYRVVTSRYAVRKAKV